MKSIIIQLTLIFSTVFLYNCKAQTTSDYITFYDTITSKFNTIAPSKTQFYGQNFSNFYNELSNKQISITRLGYGPKEDPANEIYILDLYFCDDSMDNIRANNSFRYPWVSITFKNEIPAQIKTMVLQNHGEWNSTFTQFFSNMKIESIMFLGMNGYNSTDYSAK